MTSEGLLPSVTDEHTEELPLIASEETGEAVPETTNVESSTLLVRNIGETP